MKKRELVNAWQAKTARMKEIADLCEKEARERTEAEDKEFALLKRDAEIIRMKMAAYDEPVTTGVSLENADAILREGRDKHFDVAIRLQRDIQDSTALEGTGIIPVHEKEMLEPLRAGLIWDKMGIQVLSGLSGTLRWPLHSKAVATWEGETTRVGDQQIDFRKLTMTGKRLALALPISKTELAESQGIVERVVRQEMPAACIDAINEAVLTLVAETVEGGNKVDKTVAGPFAQKVTGNDLAGGCQVMAITANFAKIRKELLDMKAAVYGAGIQRKNPGYVMSENTKAILEDTKVDAGSGRFVCEKDMVLGCPVFTSNAIPDGVIGFGDWSYQAAGFFGPTDITIDPYTLARQNSTDFVLNMKFGTVTLRKEAFVLGMTADAKAALVAEIKAIGA